MIVKIEKKYIDSLIEKTARALVGRIMKRFEISGNNDQILKKNIKELVYEQFRDLKIHLDAHSKGFDLISVYFLEKNGKENNEM